MVRDLRENIAPQFFALNPKAYDECREAATRLQTLHIENRDLLEEVGTLERENKKLRIQMLLMQQDMEELNGH
jgi:hypothetical protein